MLVVDATAETLQKHLAVCVLRDKDKEKQQNKTKFNLCPKTNDKKVIKVSSVLAQIMQVDCHTCNNKTHHHSRFASNAVGF